MFPKAPGADDFHAALHYMSALSIDMPLLRALQGGEKDADIGDLR